MPAIFVAEAKRGDDVVLAGSGAPGSQMASTLTLAGFQCVTLGAEPLQEVLDKLGLEQAEES